jgi:hypothetical protein
MRAGLEPAIHDAVAIGIERAAETGGRLLRGGFLPVG